MKKRLLLFLPTLIAFAAAALFVSHQGALAFNGNNLMDDGVFDNVNTMSAGQIDNWLNANFPSSCISTNHGFAAPDPIGYNPNQGFLYGGAVSAGRVLYDAGQAYGLNPQVLLATLQKEEGLVQGNGPYGCSALAISASVGYGCPDSGSLYSYSNLNPPLYYQNGNAVTSVSNTCVNSAAKAGFSQQIIHAAWLLKFGEQRSEGNVNWAVIKGNWDNSDDPQSCYGGPMTQGYRKRCSWDANAVYYDGYITIDSTSTHMDTGATAALYWYTPHFHGNQVFDDIFQSWFGSIYVPSYAWSISNQSTYTDASKTTTVDSTNLVAGDRVYAVVKATNNGNVTWTNSGANPVHLATSRPQDRSSAFCDPSWLSCNRLATMVEASVAPGQTGTFEFWYKAPMAGGTYREYFNLVAEGASWMNDTGLSFYTVVQPPTYTWSIAGQFAFTDSSKTTPVDLTNLNPGQKVFIGFQVKNTGNVNWPQAGAHPIRSATNNPRDRISPFCDATWLSCNRPAVVNQDNLAPGQTSPVEFWYDAPAKPGTYREGFSMVAEGITWMNDPGLNFYTEVHFDASGGDTLNTDQALTAGQSITSTNGRYRLIMQADGNLVLYSINRALWSSSTAGRPVTKAVMQADGNLVLYDAQNKAYWSSGTAGKGASKLVMQADGNLVIYATGGTATWASHTNGQF